MTNKQVYDYYKIRLKKMIKREPKHSEVMAHIAGVCHVDPRTVYRWFKNGVIHYHYQGLIDLDTKSKLKVGR